MTTYLVSDHDGAQRWAMERGIAAQYLSHLDPAILETGDMVIGTLPAHLAAQVCTRGAHYLHLAMDLPADWRHRSLSAEEMDRFGARLEEYRVVRVGDVNA